jgi:phosphate starvation-inducible membrane PsiE
MILEVLSVAAVVSNSAIIFFTGTRFDHYSLYDRAIFFIVFEHALLCVKVRRAEPSTPHSFHVCIDIHSHVMLFAGGLRVVRARCATGRGHPAATAGIYYFEGQ